MSPKKVSVSLGRKALRRRRRSGPSISFRRRLVRAAVNGTIPSSQSVCKEYQDFITANYNYLRCIVI